MTGPRLPYRRHIGVVGTVEHSIDSTAKRNRVAIRNMPQLKKIRGYQVRYEVSESEAES
jgi:hypothetical protein